MNLTIDPEVLVEMKLQAVRESDNLSRLVERLCREYLDRVKRKTK